MPEATAGAFEKADRTVKVELENNRLIANAMEPRAALAEYDEAEDSLTVTMTSQSPHGHRGKAIDHAGNPRRTDLRIVAPDVGGGFGHKGHHHPGEAMAAWRARELGRPVKWTATRSQNYLAGALRTGPPGRPPNWRSTTTGRFAAFEPRRTPVSAATDSALVPRYRGGTAACWPASTGFPPSTPVHRAPPDEHRTRPLLPGSGIGPEAVYVTERLVDRAARELDIDPADFRRKISFGPTSSPTKPPSARNTTAGSTEPPSRRRSTRWTTTPFASDKRTSGSATATVRTSASGSPDYVESTASRSKAASSASIPTAGSASTPERTPTGKATGRPTPKSSPTNSACRTTTSTWRRATRSGSDRNGIVQQSEHHHRRERASPRARARWPRRRDAFAADRLEAAPEDVELEGGEFRVVGAPERSVSFEAVADAAYGRGLPDGESAGLESTTFYEQDGTAYAFGTHVAVVSVDPDSGEIDVERYVAVDDCGEQVNPRIVEGQVHGGVAQGLGQALYEEAVYDDAGTLVTGSLQDYAVPKITQLPSMETRSTVTSRVRRTRSA